MVAFKKATFTTPLTKLLGVDEFILGHKHESQLRLRSDVYCRRDDTVLDLAHLRCSNSCVMPLVISRRCSMTTRIPAVDAAGAEVGYSGRLGCSSLPGGGAGAGPIVSAAGRCSATGMPARSFHC